MFGNLVKYFNVGGVLVFGFGCENNIMFDFIKLFGNYNEKRIKFLVV